MPDVSLRTVTRTQGNNRALKEGTVTPKRYGLAFEEVPVLVDGFRRMVRGLEFDVCEMAMTTYLCAKAHGKPFTALPIFLVRGFHHGAIVCDPKAGARRPAGRVRRRPERGDLGALRRRARRGVPAAGQRRGDAGSASRRADRPG